MDLKILKKTLKISKDYFGRKLIPENQSVHFNWSDYSIKTSELLSKLIVLNEMSHNSDIHLDNLYIEIKNVIEYDSIKRINNFKNFCFVTDLPTYVRTHNEFQTSTYYYFTTLLLINSVIDLRYKNKIAISDNEFKTMLMFLTYKQSTAIKKIFAYDLKDYNSFFNEEDIIYTLNHIHENMFSIYDFEKEHKIDDNVKNNIEEFYHDYKV